MSFPQTIRIGKAVDAMAKAEKILVIDDEQFSREYFDKILERIDYNVKTVDNGTEGLNVFNGSSYDLVILDMKLPDADGIEILRQIKEINRLTPVIMVTAYGTVKNAVQAMELLRFAPQNAALPVGKLLASAVANAEENFGVSRDDLFVAKIFADEAPTRKWRRFGARGRFKPVLRRSSHVTIVLREREVV